MEMGIGAQAVGRDKLLSGAEVDRLAVGWGCEVVDRRGDWRRT